MATKTTPSDDDKATKPRRRAAPRTVKKPAAETEAAEGGRARKAKVPAETLIACEPKKKGQAKEAGGRRVKPAIAPIQSDPAPGLPHEPARRATGAGARCAGSRLPPTAACRAA